jgi:thymidylate synthase ThyX
MKATLITTTAPENAKDSYKATPEILASSLAKYSRSNKGIDTILEGIDWSDTDGSVDRIFKFIDYGHASIGGLTGGIAITLDDCSMFLAYKIFEIAQLVDGQESSTRYITMKPTSLSSAKDMGIPTDLQDEWNSVMSESFDIYNSIYKRLDKEAQENPESLNIPKEVSEKVRGRMRKNYALDRARYFIPFATKTSSAYIMTARVWAQTLKELDSIPLKECKDAAKMIREELGKIVPRLIRHSYPDDASTYQAVSQIETSKEFIINNKISNENIKDEVFTQLDKSAPSFMPISNDLRNDFAKKTNRYSLVGPNVRRQFVRFAWNNIALAELRDLNRHRAGFRYTPLAPVGFYLPKEVEASQYSEFFKKYNSLITKLAESGNHYYGYLLGTQVSFEHSTHLDKFIYEVELRTGLGAHFRYAEHLEAVCRDILKDNPDLEKHIEIGTAEPE